MIFPLIALRLETPNRNSGPRWGLSNGILIDISESIIPIKQVIGNKQFTNRGRDGVKAESRPDEFPIQFRLQNRDS